MSSSKSRSDKRMRNEKGQFVRGHPRLSAGRPLGSRNRLGRAFIQAMYESWLDRGAPAIEEVRTKQPAAYLRVVASLVPKQTEGCDRMFDDLTDDELAFMIAYARDALAAHREGDGRESESAAKRKTH